MELGFCVGGARCCLLIVSQVAIELVSMTYSSVSLVMFGTLLFQILPVFLGLVWFQNLSKNDRKFVPIRLYSVYA